MQLHRNGLIRRAAFKAKRLPWLLFALVVCCFVPRSVSATPIPEYTPEQVEFALLVKILGFTDWENHEEAATQTPLQIGIYENEEFLKTARDLVGESGSTNQIQIHAITAKTPVDELEQLDVLFFTERSNKTRKKTVNKMGGFPVLIVGKFDGFLREGGMLNLQIKRGKTTFEVHKGESRKVGITFRGKLLKIATRVIR